MTETGVNSGVAWKLEGMKITLGANETPLGKASRDLAHMAHSSLSR